MAQKILVVDDEQDVVKILKVRLEAAGYAVIAAYDGQEGLDMAHNEKPDLIVLDLMLPKLNGYQVCRMLKFDSAYQAVPIIMLTARASEEDQKLSQEAGADAYMTKPFEPEQLLAKIRELLGAKA
jgi:DNA-binding response OmpR family regulator